MKVSTRRDSKNYKRRYLPAVCVVFLLVTLLFGGCFANAKSASDKAPIKVRVLVLKGKTGLVLKGVKNKNVVTLKLSSSGVLIDGKKEKLPFRFHPEKKVVYIDGLPYRGVLEIRKESGKLIVIDELSIEAYVAGIINHEISSKWNKEAIQAQAVVARTYALYRMKEREGRAYDLVGTHMDQVYKGAGKEDSASWQAIRATKGQVLYYDKAPALTLYHSNAGGRTEASEDVWGAPHPYLKSVKSKFDKVSPSYQWSLSLTGERLGEFLKKGGYKVGVVKKIKIKKRTKSKRIKKLLIKGTLGEVTLSGEDMRKVVGYATLRSTLFKVRKKGSDFNFKGYGSGHGVGLSQWGAKGMADNGYSYKKILRRYYPGTKLKKLY